MATLKRIISDNMLLNMEMLAVTNPAMKDILEQAKVVYVLSGSPKFVDEDDWVPPGLYIDSITDADYTIEEDDLVTDRGFK